MDFDRLRTEIRAQTELLVTELKGADLRAPVPSCPGWSLGRLVRHIGGGHRWAEEIVRTRASGFLPDGQVRRLDGDDTAELPAGWLLDGAARLAETLRAAGPDAGVWAVFDRGRAAFWARRFAHETLVHRADAHRAAGSEFAADPELVLDAVEEWLELDAHPWHFDSTPRKRDVLGQGRSMALHATDVDVAWFVDLTGEVITWRRGTGEAAVRLRAPLTELLLALYRRRPVRGTGIAVEGDGELLELYLDRAAFG